MALTRCGPFRERRRHADARRRAAWCTAGERRDKSTSSDIVRDGDNVSVWIGFNLSFIRHEPEELPQSELYFIDSLRRDPGPERVQVLSDMVWGNIVRGNSRNML